MANDLWETPQYIFDWLNDEFKFNYDVAASCDNAKCQQYYTEKVNSLKMPWVYSCGDKAYCNPPYSNPYPWVKKAYEESLKGCTVVFLLPADTSTKWFHEWVIGKAEIRLVKGRIKFIDPATGKECKDSPKFGSMIAIYGPGIKPKVISVTRPDKPKKTA